MKNSDIEKIVRQAFADGESWGVCYSTWFHPSEEDTEKRIQESIIKITEELETNNETKD